MAENGFVTMILLIGFIVYTTYLFVKFSMKKQKPFVETMIFGMLFISFISLMFSYTYTDHKYLFLSIGLLLTYRIITKSSITKDGVV